MNFFSEKQMFQDDIGIWIAPLYTSTKVQRLLSSIFTLKSFLFDKHSCIQGLSKCTNAHEHSLYFGLLLFNINKLISPFDISSKILFLFFIVLSHLFLALQRLHINFALLKSKNNIFCLFFNELFTYLYTNNIQFFFYIKIKKW